MLPPKSWFRQIFPRAFEPGSDTATLNSDLEGIWQQLDGLQNAPAVSVPQAVAVFSGLPVTVSATPTGITATVSSWTRVFLGSPVPAATGGTIVLPVPASGYAVYGVTMSVEGSLSGTLASPTPTSDRVSATLVPVTISGEAITVDVTPAQNGSSITGSTLNFRTTPGQAAGATVLFTNNSGNSLTVEVDYASCTNASPNATVTVVLTFVRLS